MNISYFTKNSNIPCEDSDFYNYFNKINDIGYYGIMFVYDSSLPDYMAFCARHLNTNHKFKFIIAMRTYAISPEYCSMICNTFHMIQNNRLCLNILSGDLQPHETSIEDVVLISEHIDTSEKRTKYTQKWLKKFFIILRNKQYKPEIIVSGFSDLNTMNASIYADKQLVMLSTYKKDMIDKIKCLGKMVSVPIFIGDNLTEKEVIEKNNNNEMMYESTIYGTEEEIINKILELKKIGITDVLIYPIDNDQENIFHSMSKKLISKINSKGL